MQKIPMTVRGAELLKEELQRLKSVERPEVIQAIAEARAHGDLKENAEYSAAKERQSFIEGRIKEVEAKLSNAHIIDIATIPQSDKVVFGATITVANVDTDESFRYQIVGEDEADIKQGKLSISAPLARAAIGKEVGDIIAVTTPAALVEYEITQVEHL